MDFTNVSNPKSNSFKVVAGITVIIIIIIIWRYKVNKAAWDKLNPVFFKKGKDGKKAHKIAPTRFYDSPNGTEFTWFFWVYVDNMVYNYGLWKNILSKGTTGYSSEHQSPGFWIYPKKNAIRIIVATNKKKDFIQLDDFPIRKWFSIGLVAKDSQLEVYMDGKLKLSRNLSARLKINTGFLHLCQNGGFGGNLSSVSYYPSAKSHRFMEVKQSKGPFDERWWDKVYSYLTGSMMALGGSINLDVDLDIPVYTSKSDTMCAGKMLKNTGVVSLSKAKELCNKDANCNCITKYLKTGSKGKKGGFRLVENNREDPRLTKMTGSQVGYFQSFTQYRAYDDELKKKNKKKNLPKTKAKKKA